MISCTLKDEQYIYIQRHGAAGGCCREEVGRLHARHVRHGGLEAAMRRTTFEAYTGSQAGREAPMA
jgi:hypothetical protein